MFTYRKFLSDVNVGPVITQPNQSFTVRQIIDQFARGEVIPTMFEASDSLSDDISDDDLENIIEFEDRIDAEAHLIDNQYKLYDDDESRKKQEDSPANREGDESSPVETVI